ncbi:lachesin-like isoform X2 [Cylas formicarius]|uniref:lachesin-like isoform X2 n=1 Tax=Cylas formicarius TaxID=197179 RepID=UPI0029586BD9|nr:lachesin-like isoform X2 [Cylas formicarius]
MDMKLFSVMCCLVFFGTTVFGATTSREVRSKTLDEDEDTYGELKDTDIQKDDYYDGDEDVEEEAPEEDNNVDLRITSQPQTIVKKLGDNVRLPCLVSPEKADPIRVWRKDTEVLYQGSVPVSGSRNMKIDNGFLHIQLRDVGDFGEYNCTLILNEHDNPFVVHKVLQQEEPRIISLTVDNEQSVLDIGDTLTLNCNATGAPRPRISWHKNNERLGTEGETFIIQSVKVKHAGSYRCLADNKIGKPAHDHIDIFINHKPIVNVEKYIVNSDHKSNVELVCHVSAYPPPAVLWQKNGMNLEQNEPKIKFANERNNQRNILLISDLQEEDFGDYTCLAQNNFGRSTQNVTVVKTPVVRHFQKPHNETKDAVLMWKVDSKQPISMHELQYRKKGEPNWKTVTPDVTNATEGDTYTIKYVLTGLDPGLYEARVRSQNIHGWSNYSPPLPFEGVLAKHTAHQKSKYHKKDQKGKDQKASTHSGSVRRSPLSMQIFAVGAILFSLLVHVRQ